jgi:EVE domain
MNWLVKEEPTHYGFDALVKDKKAVWSGVRNALAQKHLRAIKKGDRIVYYHTGDEKAVSGSRRRCPGPYADPEDGARKYVAVNIAPVKQLPRPVTLAESIGGVTAQLTEPPFSAPPSRHSLPPRSPYRYCMDRRGFVLMSLVRILAVPLGSMTALATPLGAKAQQTRKVRRIGYVTIGIPILSGPAAFVQALRDRGYVEGRNLVIERRFMQGARAGSRRRFRGRAPPPAGRCYCDAQHHGSARSEAGDEHAADRHACTLNTSDRATLRLSETDL